MRYIIVGNGPAALHAARAVREKDPQGTITLLTAEPLPAYSPCLLADLVANRVQEKQLQFVSPEFYQRHHIEVIAGESMMGLDSLAHRVYTDKERELAYDRLFLGIGAEPVMPSVPGIELDNVVPLKTLADARRIISLANSAKRVLIVGAGFIGLEIAQALNHDGRQVTVIEALDHVLPKMLDAEMAQPVKHHLADQGLEIITGSPLEAILGNQRARAAKIAGQEIPTDLVVVTAGVRPRISRLQNGTLEIGRGVRIDNHGRTSLPDVYAGGDLVEARDIFGQYSFLPNWFNATISGRTAGLNMAGDLSATFPGLEQLNVVHVANQPVCAFGKTTAESFLVKTGSAWKKYFLDGDVLAGMQWVGTALNAGVVINLIKSRRPIKGLLSMLESDRIGYGAILTPAVASQTG